MISREKAEAIRELADADGYVEPSHVWQAARKPDHPLHDEFKWDLKVAAEAHWLDTARRLIRLVKIEITIDKRIIQSVAYVVDPNRPQKSRRYVDLTIAAQQQSTAQAILLSEMERITAAVRRAQQVASVLGLRSQLDALLDNVQTIVEAAEIKPARKRRAKKQRKPTSRKRQRAPAEARV